jgi:glycosyltransferase involved in cell wall biosynthesis
VIVNPIQVLHVAGSAGWAGGEVYLLNLAKALDRHRFDLAVVVPEPGPLGERLQAHGVRVHLVPLGERLFNPSALLALVRLLRRERPSIVQSHGARSNVYTKLAGSVAGTSVILTTVHNSLFDYEVGLLRRRLYVLAERLTSPLTDRILAVSAAIARDLVHRYRIGAGKVVTIQNGIDAEAFRPRRSRSAVLTELGLNARDRLIGIAARMTLQKGHHDLLHALRLLLPRFPRLRCLLIGDGPLKPRLEQQAAALGVSARCLFTGVRPDVADLVDVVEAVVLPSRSEGLPFALLEAMALAKPVVATEVGGNPEVVEHGSTGLLVPPQDPEALAEAIAFLLDRPDAAAGMGERGRARVRERFTLDRMLRALEDVYASLLHERAGQGRAA